MNEKNFVILPAHNEAGFISKAIESLSLAKKQGVIFDFIVVANGCTDKTAEVARNLGARVLVIPEANKGKAFVEGVKLAHKEGAKVICTIDADVEKFNPSTLQELIAPVSSGKTKMVIAEVSHGIGWEGSFPVGFSGFRAMSMNALKPIITGNKEWIRDLTSTPYSLERGLNAKIFGALVIDNFTLRNIQSIGPEWSHRGVDQNILGKMRPGEKNRLMVVRPGFKVARNVRDYTGVHIAITQTAADFTKRVNRLRSHLFSRIARKRR